MTASDRHLVTGGGIVIILLLLLWWKLGGGRDTLLVHDKPTTIDVETGPVTNYNLPPLTIPRVGGPWDWMQTTDLGCGCDSGLWKQPIEIAPAPQLPQSYPVYRYITDTQYSAGPTYDFPAFVAPPLPVWWYEWGFNIKGEGPNAYIRTQYGTTLIGGKYSRASDQYGAYQDQTKYNWTQTGDNIYYNGKRFIHDQSRDYPHPKPPSLPRGGAIGYY